MRFTFFIGSARQDERLPDELARGPHVRGFASGHGTPWHCSGGACRLALHNHLAFVSFSLFANSRPRDLRLSRGAVGLCSTLPGADGASVTLGF